MRMLHVRGGLLRNRLSELLLILCTASPGVAAPQSVFYAQRDAIVRGSIEAERIVIPEGVTITAMDDVVLSGHSIEIAGVLVAAVGNGQRRSGARIELRSTEQITITGEIRAGDGAQGVELDVRQLMRGMDPAGQFVLVAEGLSGGDGGSVTINAARNAVVHIAPHATIAAGNGGHAAMVTIEGQRGSANGLPENVQAFGGNGGKGGSVLLSGATVELLGQVYIGRGGDGGDVSARGGDGAYYLPPGAFDYLVATGAYALAFGGSGGPAGSCDVMLASGEEISEHEVAAIQNLVHVGVGGRGGRAEAFAGKTNLSLADVDPSTSFYSSNGALHSRAEVTSLHPKPGDSIAIGGAGGFPSGEGGSSLAGDGAPAFAPGEPGGDSRSGAVARFVPGSNGQPSQIQANAGANGSCAPFQSRNGGPGGSAASSHGGAGTAGSGPGCVQNNQGGNGGVSQAIGGNGGQGANCANAMGNGGHGGLAKSNTGGAGGFGGRCSKGGIGGASSATGGAGGGAGGAAAQYKISGNGGNATSTSGGAGGKGGSCPCPPTCCTSGTAPGGQGGPGGTSAAVGGPGGSGGRTGGNGGNSMCGKGGSGGAGAIGLTSGIGGAGGSSTSIGGAAGQPTGISGTSTQCLAGVVGYTPFKTIPSCCPGPNTLALCLVGQRAQCLTCEPEIENCVGEITAVECEDAADEDLDEVYSQCDECPFDGTKSLAGICGCGNPDTGDSDGDSTLNCVDLCPNDPNKLHQGACGCGVSDVDSDGDSVPNCIDFCPGQDDASDACIAPAPALSIIGMAGLAGIVLSVGTLLLRRRRLVG